MIGGRADLSRAQNVVLKVGSALLKTGGAACFAALAEQTAQLCAQGMTVTWVSSGAIALGLEPMGLGQRPTAIGQLQAAAAAGQGRLISHWRAAFAPHGREVGQVLLTHADLEDRVRYLNARNALAALLAAGLVPVVNENDSVATDEIRFGDNDKLAALVASLVGADVLVLLTQVDGMMTGDPKKDPHATRLSEVRDIEAVRPLAAGAALYGTGGMASKLTAAEIAGREGIATVIARGDDAGAVAAVFAGEDVGTLFVPGPAQVKRGRHKWIGTTLRPKGRLLLDDGAARAVLANKSLLLAGVVEVDGDFVAGDAVDLVAPDGTVIARGLCQAAAVEVAALKGLRTAEAQAKVGAAVPQPLVHKDDLARFSPESEAE